MVCARVNLDSVGVLVSWIGGGSGVGFRPFVVHPPSCRRGRYHTTNCKSVLQSMTQNQDRTNEADGSTDVISVKTPKVDR